MYLQGEPHLHTSAAGRRAGQRRASASLLGTEHHTWERRTREAHWRKEAIAWLLHRMVWAGRGSQRRQAVPGRMDVTPLSTTAPLPTQGKAKILCHGHEPGPQQPSKPLEFGVRSHFIPCPGLWDPLSLGELALEHPNLLLTSSNRPAGPDPLSLPPSWTVTHPEKTMSMKGPIPASCYPEDLLSPTTHTRDTATPGRVPRWGRGSSPSATMLRLAGTW